MTSNTENAIDMDAYGKQSAEENKSVCHESTNEVDNSDSINFPLFSELSAANSNPKCKQVDQFLSFSELDSDLKPFLSPNNNVSSIHDILYLKDRLKVVEGEKLALMIDHNNLIKEFNKQMKNYLEEIRNLKESKQLVEQEAKELRDLCCLLDDKRKKCRQFAKEWQKFGRHSILLMRTEVMSYQEKNNKLELQQQELIKENNELRDLCVYLDSQRKPNDNQVGITYLCSKCSDVLSQNDVLHNELISLSNDVDVIKLQDQSSKIEQYRLKNSPNEKKRVSFSLASEDDSDSLSTTSEADSRLDFPPSFSSLENYLISGDTQGLSNLNILRRDPHSKSKCSDISPRNSNLVRLTDSSFLPGDQVHELKEKLALSCYGKATLTESDISRLKDMCHVVQNPPSVGTNFSAELTSSVDISSRLSNRESNDINCLKNETDDLILPAQPHNRRISKGSEDFNQTSDGISFESFQLV